MSTEETRPDKQPTWLVMVYMQAGDSSQLDSLAVQDLLEMEEGLRENPHVEVLVEMQRHWPGQPQRYHLGQRCRTDPPVGQKKNRDRPSFATLAEQQPTSSDGKRVSMGTDAALTSLLKAGLELNAHHNCLVLWGHAFGVGFGRFHDDPLTLKELQEALAKAGRKIDVLATNACTMSYIEAAYQLRESVEYLVASQAFVPLTGLPYKRILRGIRSTTDPLDLSKMIVDRYVEDFSDSRSGAGNARRGEKVSMTVLNLKNGAVAGAMGVLNELAVAIKKFIGNGDATDFDRLDEIRDVFLANPVGDVRPVLDLYSLTTDLIDLCNDEPGPVAALRPLAALDPLSALDRVPSLEPAAASDPTAALKDAATKLREAVRPPSIVTNGNSAPSGARTDDLPFVAYHRSDPDLEGMNGVGIFAPFVVDKSFVKELELDEDGREAYTGLRIFDKGKKTNWVSLVYDRLRFDDDDLDEIVDASGVVRPAQRIQVNQMVRAVDAAFNKLERVLRKTEATVIAELNRKKLDKLPVSPALNTFGPPKLKLAGDISLLNPDDLNKRGLKPGAPEESQSDPVVEALAKIESAVQLAEKTTRRVITNRTFGLGPPSSRADGIQLPIHLGPKPAGGELGPKPAGGELGPKPAGGELGPKPAGGELGPKPAGGELGSETGAYFASLSSDPQVAGLAVCTLIGAVPVRAKIRLDAF